MKPLRPLAWIICALTVSSTLAQSPPVGLPGVWEGTLDAGPMKLRVVFHIEKSADGKYSAKLDSPDQGATGIPVASVELAGKTITIGVPTIGGSYEGKANDAFSEIDGTWKQGGAELPLKLKRQDKPIEIKRPQNPTKPYPYDEEEVEYENKSGGVKLGGTLTLPRDRRPAPAVILITGSGPQDRDESLMGHKPFLVLADHFTRNGIAVLRVDDRGVGKSTGETMKSTSEDFVGDVLAGVEYLKTRKEIDAKKIGLCGHSEGGIVGPMAAAKSRDIAFVVMMAGTGLTGEEILYLQGAALIKAAGGDEKSLALQRNTQELIFKIIKAEKDPAVAEKKIIESLREELKKYPEEEVKHLGGNTDAAIEAQAKSANSPWFRSFLTLDPRIALAKVKCPVLAINGELDLQVPSKENLPEIEKTLKGGGNKDVTVKELPKMNHLFQTATTGAVAEYSQIEETISPAALDLMTAWIKERTR
jgi:pimeloyl-ACP methyl ester carboxylesterase